MKNKDVPYAVATGNKTALVVLGIVCVMSVFLTISFAFLWSVEYAKKQKSPEPMIYEVDRITHQVVRIERGELNKDKASLLRSSTLRNYVIWRESINHMDEVDFWGKVRLLSSNNVFDDFRNLMDPSVNPDSLYANEDFERKIEIITDYPISEDTHRVEYDVIDTYKGEEGKPRRYVAVMTYDNSNTRVIYNKRFINIDGLLITRYDIRKL